MSDTTTAFGLECAPLPEGHIPLGVICVIKALDDEGDPVLFIRATGFQTWEELGALETVCAQRRLSLAEAYESHCDDDGEDGAGDGDSS